MIRATKGLQDLIDEVELAELVGVTIKRLRSMRSTHDAPQPIARPDNQKPLWLRAEIEPWALNMARHESTCQIIHAGRRK